MYDRGTWAVYLLTCHPNRQKLNWHHMGQKHISREDEEDVGTS